METQKEGQLYASFLDDGERYIRELNSDLIRLEKEPEDEGRSEHAFRTAHSLKSEASYLGEKEIADTAHKVETHLESLRRGEALNGDTFRRLFSATDALEEMLELRRSQRSEAEQARTGGQAMAHDSRQGTAQASEPQATEARQSAERSTGSRLHRAAGRKVDDENLRLPEFGSLERRLLLEARDRGEEFFRISVDLDTRTSMAYAKAYLLLNNLEQLVQVVRSEPPFGGLQSEAGKEASAAGGAEAPAAEGEPGAEYHRIAFYCTGTIDRGEMYRAINIDQITGIRISPLAYSSVLGEPQEAVGGSGESVRAPLSVRVEGRDIDEMNGYIDELKIRSHRLRRYYDEPSSSAGEYAAIPYEQIELLTELADGLDRLAKRVATVSLKEVLEPHRRLVRDLAAENNKRVELEIEGEELQVDRRAAEIISELTVHLLRNAVVHGIERPEQRRAAGKEPAGRVTIDVEHGDELLYVQVSDDGAGINEELLHRRAEEMGIELERDAEQPLLSYLAYPGLTTQGEANEYSGRGYGLDLVYRKLRQLEAAKLEVEYETGAGAAFTLVFPSGFTLTALQILRYRDGLIAVPGKQVERRLTPAAEEFARGEKGELLWNGLPVYSPEGRLYYTETTPAQREGLLIRYLGKEGLLLVDEVLFEKEIPEDRLTLYIEGSPYLHRMAISGNDADFSYLSPSILTAE